jgi:integrase
MKGCIYPRGERKWALVIDLPRGTDGKRKQKWHTITGTKKDAERELTRLLHELNTGGYVEPSKLTVGKHLEQWLKDIQPTVTPKTLQTYRGHVRAQIVPALGHIRLDKLTARQIQTFYTDTLSAGRKDGKGGLSAQSVKHIHRVLSTALAQAVRLQLLLRNPCAAVEPPRTPRREMHCLDESQTVQLLSAARGTRLYIPILLAVTTGMRRGEILGLRWADVDLEAGVLAVRQSLEQTIGNLRFKTPKSGKSRVVSLPEILQRELHKHKGAQAERRLLLGSAYQNHDLICPQENGGPWHPDSLTHGFAVLIRGTDLPPVRFHDLRHSHATQLFKRGVNVKVVSERLGHSTATLTLDVYSHVLPGMQQEAARHVDAALSAAVGDG